MLILPNLPKKVRCAVRGVRYFFYICNYEYRIRFGIVKSEMGFPLVFALAFHYVCKHEYRIRFGIVKSEI